MPTDTVDHPLDVSLRNARIQLSQAKVYLDGYPDKASLHILLSIGESLYIIADRLQSMGEVVLQIPPAKPSDLVFKANQLFKSGKPPKD